jgi:hypothetical protein
MKRWGIFCGLAMALAAPAAAAPPSFTGCMVNYVSDRSAQIVCFLSAAAGNYKFRVLFDYDTTLDRATAIQGSGSDGSLTRNERIASLPPGADVFFSPLTTDKDGATWSSPLSCPVTCTNCGPNDHPFFLDAGPGHSRINCTAGEPMRFQTLPLVVCEGGPPCHPAGPAHQGLTTPPVVTGSSRTVAPGCTNLQALINNAADHAKTGGTVEEILLPPGEETCRPENESSRPLHQYSLPNACPGRVLIRSGADPKLLPPPGTAIDPSYLPHTGKLSWNRKGFSDLDQKLLQFETGSGCYYFSAISFQPPSLKEMQSLAFAIDAINPDNDTIRIAGNPAALGNGDRVLVNLAGSGVRGADGLLFACAVKGPTFQLRRGGCDRDTIDLQGAYTSGGTIRRSIALPIQAISNETPVRLTVPSHGFSDDCELPIRAGGRNTITLNSAIDKRQIPNNTPVYVQHTSNKKCDGIWNAKADGPRIILEGAACDGVSSGTVRRVKTLIVFGTSDEDLGGVEPRAWHFAAQDADTLVLLDSAAQGPVDQSGFVTSDVPELGHVLGKVDDGREVTDLTLDRVLIHRPFPWRSRAGIALRCDRCAYVNSWDQSERWRIPGSRMSNEPYYSLYFSGSRDFQIENNTLYRHPFLMIDNSGRGAQNITIARNTLWNPDSTVFHPDNPESNGLHYRHTFCIELKACKNCRISGNYYKGCRADFNRNGAAVSLAGSGDVSKTPRDVQMADVEFAYNTIDRAGGGFMVAANDGGASRRRLPTERIWGHDNLIVRINKKYGLDCCAGGTGLYAWDSTVDFIWERNTYHVESAPKPFDTQCGGRGQGHRNRNNIYVATRGPFEETGFAQMLGGNERPQPTAGLGSGAFQECFVSGANPDPLSSFENNVIIPGVEASTRGAFKEKAASQNKADTWCAQDAMRNPQLRTFGGLRFVGSTANPCKESFNERLDAAFEPGTWKPKSAYAGNGADVDALEDQQGWIQNVTVTADSPTQVTIGWIAPTTAGCWTQITPTTFSDAGKLSDWTQATEGNKSQSVVFSGLAPGMQYAYRVSCGKPADIGLFTTASE